MDRKKWKYENPVDENGKPYWVPLVVKNRDTLLGLLLGTVGAETITGRYMLPLENDNIYSSTAYSDILFNGEKVSEILEKYNNDEDKANDHVREIYIKKSENITKSVMEQSENKDNSKMYDALIDLECTCGFPIRFEAFDEIPEEKCHCPMCDKIIIDYTNKEYDNMEYNGHKLTTYQNDMEDDTEDEEEDDNEEWK